MFDINLTLLRQTVWTGLTLALGLGAGAAVWAQPDLSSQSADYSADTLSELVGPIALYPDDLIAIVLPASTYPVQIVQAARFLDELEDDPSLEPDPNWDNAVVALLNYPEVLRMMDEDLDWTWALGEAVLSAQASVIDAVQDFRDRAYAAGNLQSDDRQIVTNDDGVVSIVPADPEVVYVPYYEPERVVVYQPYPVYSYYADPYPLYYYPYPAGYRFRTGFFWGVTSAFSIGWSSHYLHVHHHSHLGHPYYRHNYYTPYYARRGVNININLNHVSHVWQPTHYRGARPQRDVVRTTTRSGYTNDRGGDRRRATVAGTNRRAANSAGVDSRRVRDPATRNRGTSDGSRGTLTTRDQAQTPTRAPRRITARRNGAAEQVERGTTRAIGGVARTTRTDSSADVRSNSRAGTKRGTSIVRQPDDRSSAPTPSRAQPNRLRTSTPTPTRQSDGVLDRRRDRAASRARTAASNAARSGNLRTSAALRPSRSSSTGVGTARTGSAQPRLQSSGQARAPSRAPAQARGQARAPSRAPAQARGQARAPSRAPAPSRGSSRDQQNTGRRAR